MVVRVGVVSNILRKLYIYSQVYLLPKCTSKLQHDTVVCGHQIYCKTNCTALESLSVAHLIVLNLDSVVLSNMEEDCCKIYLSLLHVLYICLYFLYYGGQFSQVEKGYCV